MKKGIIIMAGLLVASVVCAKPARKGGIEYIREDGSKEVVYLHGDEFFHWYTDGQGNRIVRTLQGEWQPAQNLSEEEISRQQSTRRATMSRRTPTQQAASTPYPINLAPKGLIILVNYKDKSFTTARQEVINKIKGDNYTRSYSYKYGSQTYKVTSKGSAKQYFHDVSNGQYNPEFDVVGPVKVSQNMSYYGGNDKDGYDKHADTMIKEACQLAEDSVNFKDYDNDGDGYVDFVYVIYAGYGEADGGEENTIWPHSWDISDSKVKVDGVYVGSYACSNELNYYSKVMDGIGTFCHEFGHVLGLPDIYSTNSNATHKTSGEWDIMDYGCYNNDGNTPSTYTAYERFFLGWATPRVLTNPENITLGELQSTNEVLLICSGDSHNLKGNDPNPATFYLLDNRQQKDWDLYIPGHGMMLTKIKYSYNTWYNNEVNYSKSSMCVDIQEADGKAPSYSESNYNNGYFGKQKDLFPAGATSVTPITGHEITNITEGKDSVISFVYRGGPTPVENVEIDPSEVIAIYLPTGAKVAGTDMSRLPGGMYILQTKNGARKVVKGER